MIREDLCELIAYASSVGLRPALGSNGTLLTHAKAAELKKASLGGIAISIDSATPEYHNRFRNGPEGWQQALEGIHA
ncbi:radical SAM protein (plasmid) [Paenibacillus polymyxa]|uniref:radical SAM protein n=1 Tax=Paenibacillus polymyxa TaxID=1406 RepID=UPI003B5A6786